MGKCKCGAEFLKSAKFCGECGEAKPAEDGACGSCDAPMLKSAKFCGECGEATAAGAVAGVMTALGLVDEFLKARTTMLTDLAELPDDVALDAADAGRIDSFLKAHTVREENGDEGIEAVPVMTEFIKSMSEARLQSRADSQHLLGYLKHLGEGQALLLKSVQAIGRQQLELDAQLAGQRKEPRGRKGREVLTVEPSRRAAGEDAAAFFKSYVGEDGERHPLEGAEAVLVDEVLLKANTPGTQLNAALNVQDVGVLEHYHGTCIGHVMRSPHAELGKKVKNLWEASAAA